MSETGPSALFTPISIGKAQIRNRTVMPPMTTRYATEEGFATAQTIAYYRARARGGVGLITVEMAAPEVAGRHRFHELGIYHDKFLPGLTDVVSAIHAEGAKASIQLGHGGSRARRAVSQVQPIAPSAIPTPVFEIEQEIAHPEAMSIERIGETVDAFVAAAGRAAQAGFDVVELHAAHGYLDRVKQGMRQVYTGSQGTARSYFKDLEYTAAGKTGTAEINYYDDKDSPYYTKASVNTTHVGFAPFENPEVAYAVMIPYITTDPSHVPPASNEIARAALDKYFELKNKQSNESPSVIKSSASEETAREGEN